MTQIKSQAFHTLVLLTLALSLRATTGIAAAAHARYPRDVDEEKSEAPGTTEETFDEAKLEIWRNRIDKVIDDKLTTMCRIMIRAVKSSGETPTSACTQLRDNRYLMRLSCTFEDVEYMEEAVCSYWSIVITTQSPQSISTSLISSRSLPVAAIQTSLSSTPALSSPPMTPSSSLQSSSSSSSSSSLSSNSSPKPISLAAQEVTVNAYGPRKQREIISKDIRLSEKCNQILPHLASAIAERENRHSGCKALLRVASQSEATQDTQDSENLPDASALLIACTQEEVGLLHEILCTQEEVDTKPAHALEGKQLKEVRYVIKTKLSATCRDALSPLGEGGMQEDVEDSCLSLSGSEADQLVTSEVCTRQDVDNLLSVVCDAAPRLLQWTHQTALLTTLSLITYIFTKCHILS